MSDSYKPQGDISGNNGVSGSNGLGNGGLTDHAKSIGRDLKTQASELTETVTRVAKDQAGQLTTAAKDLATDATGQVKTAVNAQKAASADYLGTIAQAAHRAAGEFDHDVPQAAQYIRQAAGQIETVANAVRQRDMGELVGEVQEFARRSSPLACSWQWACVRRPLRPILPRSRRFDSGRWAM